MRTIASPLQTMGILTWSHLSLRARHSCALRMQRRKKSWPNEEFERYVPSAFVQSIIIARLTKKDIVGGWFVENSCAGVEITLQLGPNSLGRRSSEWQDSVCERERYVGWFIEGNWITISHFFLLQLSCSCIQGTVVCSQTSSEKTPTCSKATDVCFSKVFTNPSCQGEGR